MASCRLCQEEIYFDENRVSERTGRMIPLEDPVTLEAHRCAAWESQHRKYYPCRKCGAEIYFDDKTAKSKNNKWVPQDKISGEPHQCDDENWSAA